uniref:RING-type E3 ubiquitin transferase n=1 Tax=Gossypium raimondii TaxID=29730 RepID=A0A0D2RDM3_GOSRA|nr:hypothetical protein B456_010G253700 [Gossypium raimondii]
MSTQFPDDFKCPISLEIMSDPVILSSGHTFDRVSIQRWLDSGHRTCPITKLPLPEHPWLIPNHALRSLISNYTLVSPSKSQPCSQPQTLVSALTSPSSPIGTKLDSLTHLAGLTKRDSSLRRKLTESGAVPAVLKFVDSEDPVLQEKALSLLLNLSLDDDNKVGLVAEGAVNRVVKILRIGSPDCRAIAATIITSLAVVEVNKATIGAYPDAIPALVRLLIAGLERAIEVLGLLVKCKEGREEMMKVNGCVKVLVKVLKNGSSRGVQYGLFTLNCLCNYSEIFCFEARKQGVLGICMGLVEEENEKIKRYLSNLVQTLSGNHANG